VRSSRKAIPSVGIRFALALMSLRVIHVDNRLLTHSGTSTMKHTTTLLLFLTVVNLTPAAEPEPIKVGRITVEFGPNVKDNWKISDFRWKDGTDLTIECIAVRRGKIPLNRWYGYDADGVKISEGPLDYQDYPQGEKTLIEMRLGSYASRVTRIKITVR